MHLMHLLRPPGVLKQVFEAPHADRFSNTVRRLSPAGYSIVARHGYSRREFDRPPTLRAAARNSIEIDHEAGIGLRRSRPVPKQDEKSRSILVVKRARARIRVSKGSPT